jgi:hypothetical protein
MKKILYGFLIISSLIYAESYQADNRDKGFEQECKNEIDHRNAENLFYSGKMYGILDMATYSTPKAERNPQIKGYSASNIIRIICNETLNDVHGNRQYGFFSNYQWHTLKIVAN